MDKKCLNCGVVFNVSDKRQKFCSRSCSATYNNKNRFVSKRTRKKTSDTLFARNNDGLSRQQVIQRKCAEKHASYIRKNENITLRDLSKRTCTKIFKRMKLPCSNCGWYVDGAVGDIHHIIEQKKGGSNEHDNLSYLCPNCHRLVHSGIINATDLICLDDYIGDEWRDYYFIKYNINEKD